jgi:methionine sulfoxide reductase heme-binding subunit
MPTMGSASAATGVLSMLLLTAVVVLGISVNRRGRLPGLPAYAGVRLHRYVSLLTVGFLAMHILTAVSLPVARIGLAAAVIPSGSLWIGLGAVSFDLLIALVATSLLRRHVGHRWWRAVHWLAYGCWPAAIAHSIGAGPGLHPGRLFDLAICCVAAVLAAGCWRLIGTAYRGDWRGNSARRDQRESYEERGQQEAWLRQRLPQDRWQPGERRLDGNLEQALLQVGVDHRAPSGVEATERSAGEHQERDGG